MSTRAAGAEPSMETLQAELRRIKRRRSFGSVLAGTFYGLLTVALIALALSHWFPVLLVRGNAMAPNLLDGEFILAQQDAAWERGDLIAFSYGERLLVKRVIAGPGDVVEMNAYGDLFINGEYTPEPYAQRIHAGDGDVQYPLTVPEERWFVMGDDRGSSLDSRHTSLGCVAREQIIGRVVARIWPLDKAGSLQ